MAKPGEQNREILEVEFDEEVHCDECMEIVHVHFADKCPCCSKSFAGTSIYCDLDSCLVYDGGKFECSSCEAEFQLMERLDLNNWKVAKC